MKYTIPRIPPSNNRYIGRNAAWKYREEKREWEWLVRAYCRPPPKTPVPYARVSIKYYFPTATRRDPDNYSGKFILDGLVKAGVLQDDSFACIKLTIEADCDKANPRTEIEVTRE